MPATRKQKINIQCKIQYRERVLDPISWINQAEKLIQASRKLEPSIKKYWLTVSKFFDPIKGTYNPPPEFQQKRLLQDTYFMLVAYAIENYFKAILVVENREKYSHVILRTGNLPEDLKKNGHDLIALSMKIKTKLSLTDVEISLLTRLYRHSVWQGRYPVPHKADDLNSMATYDGKGFDVKAIGLWPDDIDGLKILIRRIKSFSSAKALASEQGSSYD